MKDKTILEIIDDEVDAVTKELENMGKDPNDNTERWRIIAKRYLNKNSENTVGGEQDG